MESKRFVDKETQRKPVDSVSCGTCDLPEAQSRWAAPLQMKELRQKISAPAESCIEMLTFGEGGGHDGKAGE